MPGRNAGQPVRETVILAIEHLPRNVSIVDEMADLTMVAGKEIEACAQPLAQMARASGIHLIMATQRPSVDVITGTIKADFPTRVSFRLSSKIDSRTILNEQGAEKPLGQGDMLYQEAGSRATRIHGAFVSEEEIDDIVAHLRGLGPPTYVLDVTVADEDAMAEIPGMGGDSDGDGGGLLERAVEVQTTLGRACLAKLRESRSPAAARAGRSRPALSPPTRLSPCRLWENA